MKILKGKKLKKIKKLEIHEIILMVICLIQLSFYIIKITELVTWSWWIICSPVIVAMFVLVFLGVMATIFITSMSGEE